MKPRTKRPTTRAARAYVGELAANAYRVPDTEAPPVTTPDRAADLLRPTVLDPERERFAAIYLTTRNHPIAVEVVSIGSLNASVVHPREVFRPAVAYGAAALILGHNHPSGDPTPSEEDLAITRRLVDAGRLLGIDVLDHLIVTPNGCVSFRERRLLRS